MQRISGKQTRAIVARTRTRTNLTTATGVLEHTACLSNTRLTAPPARCSMLGKIPPRSASPARAPQINKFTNVSSHMVRLPPPTPQTAACTCAQLESRVAAIWKVLSHRHHSDMIWKTCCAASASNTHTHARIDTQYTSSGSARKNLLTFPQNARASAQPQRASE